MAQQSTRSSRSRSDWRRRVREPASSSSITPPPSSKRFRRVSIDNLESAGSELLLALLTDGAVVLVGGATERSIIANLYDSCRKFFALPFDAKAQSGAASGPGQLHGYMEYLTDPEGSECFEAKLHHDPRFVWPTRPASMRAAVLNARPMLIRHACRALFALVDALGLDGEYVASLLDADDEGRSIDFERCSHTAMRVWQYTHGRPTGWHVDNGFVTLAPRGTSVGLRVRTLSDRGRVCFPEEEMEEGELLLFAGDSLSYITDGKVPSLMHEVHPPAGSGQNGVARLSAPLFLRGRHAAELRSSEGGSGLPPLKIATLEKNVGNLRQSWPWKRPGAPLAAYYGASEWHAET